MMVEIGKEYGFTWNFDMPRPFTPRITELRRKMANSQSDCRTAPCIPENELTLGTRLRQLMIWLAGDKFRAKWLYQATKQQSTLLL